MKSSTKTQSLPNKKSSTAQKAHVATEIINETACMGDACIRQLKQPMWA